jgi:hypothetical protein
VATIVVWESTSSSLARFLIIWTVLLLDKPTTTPQLFSWHLAASRSLGEPVSKMLLQKGT